MSRAIVGDWNWRRAVAESDLQSTTRHVLLTLSLHVSDAGEGAFPSVRTLVRQTGLTKPTVKKHLNLAVEAGWITRRSRHTDNGRQTSNLYALTKPEGEGVTKQPPPHLVTPSGGSRDYPPTSLSGSERKASVRNGELELELEPEPTDTEAVFEYWAHQRHTALGRNGTGPQQQLTKGRRRKVQARLNDGYTVADLKQAIDGLLSSEYHLEHGYTDLALICRDQEHVEKYRAKARDLKPEVGSPEWLAAENARIERAG